MVDRGTGSLPTMKRIKVTPPKTRREYDETFKREALAHWLASGKSAEVISEELGLTSGRLFAWKKHFAPAGASEAKAGAKWTVAIDLQSRLDEALRENRHLREQRDILKKTLGILSEPVTNVLPGLTR